MTPHCCPSQRWFVHDVVLAARPLRRDEGHTAGVERWPEAQEEQLRTFERAVALEREVIAVHERAALLPDEAASLFGGAASAQLSERRIADLLGRAESERAYASGARARALTAHARLAAEGQDGSLVTATS